LFTQRVSYCLSATTTIIRLSKDHRIDDIHTPERAMTNKIMSIESLDHEVEFYMVKEPTMTVKRQHSSQMADGDKKYKNRLENSFDKFQQHMNSMRYNDIIRPVPCKPVSDSRLKPPFVSII